MKVVKTCALATGLALGASSFALAQGCTQLVTRRQAAAAARIKARRRPVVRQTTKRCCTIRTATGVCVASR